MSTVKIPVSPVLIRTDGKAATLAEIAAVTGYIRVAGSPVFTPIASLPPAATVDFVIPDITAGDYEFQATVTDTQVPPVISAPSAIKAFNVPVIVVVLAALQAPTIGDVVIT